MSDFAGHSNAERPDRPPLAGAAEPPTSFPEHLPRADALEGGGSLLARADAARERANLLALDARQRTSRAARALASQARQGVLSLFD